MDRRCVSYIRVSREEQGRSGLGLDGQRQRRRIFLASRAGDLLAKHTEIESGAVKQPP